jgi:hypothetical protein
MKKYLGFIAATCLLVEGFGVGAAMAEGKFGAIAANAEHTHYGIANNHNNQADSDHEALANCTDHCTVVMQYSNTCVAIARGHGVLGWAGNVPSADAAEAAAHNSCESYAAAHPSGASGGTCQTVFAACTDR